MWIAPDAVSDIHIFGWKDANGYIFRGNASPGQISLSFANSAGTVILQFRINTNTTSDQYSHLAVSVDLSDNAKRHVKLNGTTPSVNWNTYTNDSMDFAATSGTCLIGNGFITGRTYAGEMQYFWFAPGQYLDLDNSANLAKFIDSDFRPVALGDHGETPTGTAPAIYFAGTAASFDTNLGTGGAFTLFGTLSDGTTNVAL